MEIPSWYNIDMNTLGHFNVLERQEDISRIGKSIASQKIRFEDLPKPTNLEPLEPVKPPEKDVEFNIKTLSAKNTFSQMTSANLEKDLVSSREDYAELLALQQKKIEADKEKYKQLIANFNVEREMPKKEEPKELVLARLKYMGLLDKKRLGSKQDEITIDLEENKRLEELIKTKSLTL